MPGRGKRQVDFTPGNLMPLGKGGGEAQRLHNILLPRLSKRLDKHQASRRL